MELINKNKNIIKNIEDIEKIDVDIKQVHNVDITSHIITDILNDVINSIIETSTKKHNIDIIDTYMQLFKNLIYKELVKGSNQIHKYEFSRYVTICTLLYSFVTNLLSQTIDEITRKRLKRMYYMTYKNSKYHKEFRKFNILLRLNHISFKKHLSVKTVVMLNTLGQYINKQLVFLNKLLSQKRLLCIIERDTLDDFLCKIIFACTLIIRLSSL
jgi:hypothetical protein